MPYTAFETADVITDYDAVLQSGFTAVGVYARADRCPFEMAQGLIKAGVKLWTVFEAGFPTSDAYFSVAQAEHDARALIAWMKMQGQPKGSYAGPAVDYDARPSAVSAYLKIVHDALKVAGFLHMPYGSGSVLGWAMDAGYAHAGWLAQSQGWTGYNAFAPRAAIIQAYTPGTSPLGLSGNFNTVRNPAVLWG